MAQLIAAPGSNTTESQCVLTAAAHGEESIASCRTHNTVLSMSTQHASTSHCEPSGQRVRRAVGLAAPTFMLYSTTVVYTLTVAYLEGSGTVSTLAAGALWFLPPTLGAVKKLAGLWWRDTWLGRRLDARARRRNCPVCSALRAPGRRPGT